MSVISNVTPAAVPLTMSSREIAELTGKRHDNVMRTIEQLVTRGAIRAPQFEETEEINNLGLPRRVQQFRFNGEQGKRDSIVIAAQLSPEFTARLVDRWLELEAAKFPAVPQTMAQALRLAADQAEQIEQQAAVIALAAPKVAFVDRYVSASTGHKGFREVCKLLQANENQFRDFLLREKIMYVLAGKWTPHAQHLDTGRFVVKTGTAPVNDHAYAQAKFTPKGVEWIAGLWGQHKAALALESGVQA